MVPWSMAPTKVGRIMALDFLLNLLLLSLLEKDESIHKLLVLLYEQGQGGVSIGWREREEE